MAKSKQELQELEAKLLELDKALAVALSELVAEKDEKKRTELLAKYQTMLNDRQKAEENLRKDKQEAEKEESEKARQEAVAREKEALEKKQKSVVDELKKAAAEANGEIEALKKQRARMEEETRKEKEARAAAENKLRDAMETVNSRQNEQAFQRNEMDRDMEEVKKNATSQINNFKILLEQEKENLKKVEAAAMKQLSDERVDLDRVEAAAKEDKESMQTELKRLKLRLKEIKNSSSSSSSIKADDDEEEQEEKMGKPKPPSSPKPMGAGLKLPSKKPTGNPIRSDRFKLDNDTCLLSSALLLRGLIWQYKYSIGDSYAESYEEYQRYLEHCKNQDIINKKAYSTLNTDNNVFDINNLNLNTPIIGLGLTPRKY